MLDVWLPGMDGLATLARLRERQVDAQIVLISGHGNIESAVRAIKLGAFDFVEKPLSLDKTVLVVRNALRNRTLAPARMKTDHSDRRRRARRAHRVERRAARRGLRGRGGLQRRGVPRARDAGAVDLIVLDVWLPGMDGLDTLARLRERQVDAQVVLISGHGNIESAVRAIKLGAFDFVEKPLSLDKTVLVVRNALRQRRLEAENRALRARVDRNQTMVGESYAMRQLREQVAMAAPTNGRVLIYGENGTGKELVARTIHALSRRRAGGRSSRSTARRFPKS